MAPGGGPALTVSSDPSEEEMRPDLCGSDAEKLAFLQALVDPSEKEYSSILEIVAQMGVSVYFEVNL